MANTTMARSKKGSTAQSSNQDEEIAKQAYQFFLERGCEHGHDTEDWLRAEAMVRNKK